MIPTPEECFKMMDKYGMPDNIKAHSIMVERVASIIASGIIKAGFDILMDKVIAGALMHDIGKAICLNSSNDHAAIGKEICIKNDLTEISEIVEEHIRLKSYDPDGPVSEKEIIYYSDKRVNHDTVVSIEERLEYLIERYSKGIEDLNRLIRQNFDLCMEVEKKLFSRLDFTPADLPEMVEKAGKS